MNKRERRITLLNVSENEQKIEKMSRENFRKRINVVTKNEQKKEKNNSNC
jgi:hypothetical protein